MSAYVHPLLPFGASFARKSSAQGSAKFVVRNTLHGFNDMCEPNPSETKFDDALGNVITPGISICFAGDILEAVETETLVFLRELVEAMPILAPKRFYIVAVPVLLSPAKFKATGSYIKDHDIDAALTECGFARRTLHGQNEKLLVLPLYLPHEVSQRTPERRTHLASRTATLCGGAVCRTALSTPDDYAVWQVTRALMLLAGIDLSNAPAQHTLLDRSGKPYMPVQYGVGGGRQESGIGSLVQRDALTETSIRVDMNQIHDWSHNMRQTLSRDKNATDDMLVAALAEEIWSDDGSKAERENIMRRAMEKAESLTHPAEIAAVLGHASDRVQASLAERMAPERRDHANLMARLTVDVAKILPRTVALARREYDYDGTIAGLSTLWAEGMASARFA